MKYFQADHPGSFSGTHSFQKALGFFVTKWLKTEDAYTLHRPVRKKFLRRVTITPGSNFQMQEDLIDFSWLKKWNGGFKYILVLVDVFSKVAHAIFLKKKSSQCMIEAFTSLLQKAQFAKLQTDRGTEFTNAPLHRWLQSKNIELFHTHNFDMKANVTERFI